MPKDLTVTALAMWGLFILGIIVGTCYCYYSDNHLDEKLGVSKGKVKLSAAIISGVFFILAIYQTATCYKITDNYRLEIGGLVFDVTGGNSVIESNTTSLVYLYHKTP